MATSSDHVFGHGHDVHPIRRRPIETGIGSLHPDKQAMLHLASVEMEEGKEVAAKMRETLQAHMKAKG